LRFRASFWLLLIIATPVRGELAAELETCAARLHAAVAETTIDRACPELAVSLGDSRWSGSVPALTALTSQTLDSLLLLDGFYTSQPPDSDRDYGKMADALDGILAELAEPPPRLSLWQQFNAWFNTRLGEWWQSVRIEEDSLPDWLADLLKSTGKLLGAGLGGLFRTLGWVAVAILAALGIWGIAVLLRDGNRRFTERPGYWWSCGATAVARASPTLASLDEEPLRLRPRLLLRIVLAILRREQRIGPDATLTHRELATAATALTATERDALDRVAGLAERVTYSAYLPTDPDVSTAIDDGRLLIREGAP
jgi:hypothetical protein